MFKNSNTIKAAVLSLFILLPLTSQAGLISGTKWGDPTLGTAGGEVTWSLMDSGIVCDGPYEDPGCVTTSLASFMPAGFLAQIQAAFDMWEAVANITFKMVADGGEVFGGAPSSADIRIGGHAFDGSSGVLAHGYYPWTTPDAGDIHFDIAENWNIGGGAGFIDIHAVTVHEIGHAIGIRHSDVIGAIMYPYYGGAITALHADDIATVQSIYGAKPITDIPEPSMFAILLLLLSILVFQQRQSFFKK